MKKTVSRIFLFLFLTTGSSVVSAFQQKPDGWHFPYQNAGLTERQAAAHLLSRFTFGATPGQVDAIVKMGLEKWFDQQLNADIMDAQVEEKLAGYESLRMTSAEIAQTYLKPGQVLRMAIKDGVVDKDAVKGDNKASRDALKEYMQKKGIRPQAELLRQLVAQKIIRAAYSPNQLQEVMVDFWFNHFNVALSKGGVAPFITAYERDAIRPNALGSFETLLLATAKSPAMLTYLDNNRSTVDSAHRMGVQKSSLRKKAELTDTLRNAKSKTKKPKLQGLNENYARELMELHTLGVDGGYTQSDVTEAARVLTGWRINPLLEYNLKQEWNNGPLKRAGFVADGDFLFAASKHDRGAKNVLGQIFPAGGGYNEGLRLMHLLATHSATAKFISKKIAVHFVSDAPPQSLIDKMAKTFLETGGNIKDVLRTLVSSPEFWAKDALREKTKAPFEVAISAVRSTGAQVEAPYPLYQWISKMGQPLYNYQAPTGFPDRGPYWINTGALLNRMNFGLAFAAGRIPGLKLNLLLLNQNHEPESSEAALQAYSKLLMPERDVTEATKQLAPMLHAPELAEKVDEAAGKTTLDKATMQEEADSLNDSETKKTGKKAFKKGTDSGQMKLLPGNSTMLAQVVGLIIGSPEFQRR